MWSPNGLGLFFGLNYVYQFIKYTPTSTSDLPGTVSQHVYCSAIFMVFTALIASYLGTELASNIIGNLGVLVCIVLVASPLAALKTVIQTRSAESIPLPFTLTCILNCFLWFVYGIDINDFHIYVPNMLGLLASLAQFALILMYGNGRPHQLPLVHIEATSPRYHPPYLREGIATPHDLV